MTLVRFNAEIKVIWTDFQVQHLHNLQYTCKTIVENRNGEITNYINNSVSIWLRFRNDRLNK